MERKELFNFMYEAAQPVDFDQRTQVTMTCLINLERDRREAYDKYLELAYEAALNRESSDGLHDPPGKVATIAKEYADRMILEWDRAAEDHMRRTSDLYADAREHARLAKIAEKRGLQ